MRIHVTDIEWEIDEHNLLGVQSHTGERWGDLYSDAERELDGLPTEMDIFVDGEVDLDDLYMQIELQAFAFYCSCTNYVIDDIGGFSEGNIKLKFRNRVYGNIEEWNIHEVLEEINRDRSEEWTDYDESDWLEGLDMTDYDLILN